ncbi:hypothetical protein MCEGE10_02390 [Flavobacteriaceae bacterium]
MKGYVKKTALLFFVCFAEFISAQIPSYVPTNGLKAYYPFNGNVNDINGNSTTTLNG